MASETPAGLPTVEEGAPLTFVPQAPEANKSGGGKRKRLSKAFARPLDKILKKQKRVHDVFSMPEADYAQLAVLKARLLVQGTQAKKSELVRAGLLLLSSLDDEALRAAFERLLHKD